MLVRSLLRNRNANPNQLFANRSILNLLISIPPPAIPNLDSCVPPRASNISPRLRHRGQNRESRKSLLFFLSTAFADIVYFTPFLLLTSLRRQADAPHQVRKTGIRAQIIKSRI